MKTKQKHTNAAMETTPAALSDTRRAAGARGLASRWGEARQPSRQIRVDEAAADALLAVPERDRRAFASRAIVDAVGVYRAKGAKRL